MTLAGLSLGIGMLVDNSVVVIENVYRLRSRGVPAARAAVQGTKQVGMSVVASTLTSVCVFLPVVFSASLVRSLMMPMSLCIGYCLMASPHRGAHGGPGGSLHCAEKSRTQAPCLV